MLKFLVALSKRILALIYIFHGILNVIKREQLDKKEKFKMSDILPDIYPYLFQLGDIILNILLEQCCKPKSSNNSRADYQTLPSRAPVDQVLSDVNNRRENRAKIREEYVENKLDNN